MSRTYTSRRGEEGIQRSKDRRHPHDVADLQGAAFSLGGPLEGENGTRMSRMLSHLISDIGKTDSASLMARDYLNLLEGNSTAINKIHYAGMIWRLGVARRVERGLHADLEGRSQAPFFDLERNIQKVVETLAVRIEEHLSEYDARELANITGGFTPFCYSNRPFYAKIAEEARKLLPSTGFLDAALLCHGLAELNAPCQAYIAGCRDFLEERGAGATENKVRIVRAAAKVRLPDRSFLETALTILDDPLDWPTVSFAVAYLWSYATYGDHALFETAWNKFLHYSGHSAYELRHLSNVYLADVYRESLLAQSGSFNLPPLPPQLQSDAIASMEKRQAGGRPAPNGFETEVATSLQRLNYPFEPQVFQDGYFIDMVAWKGEVKIAVECDSEFLHNIGTGGDGHGGLNGDSCLKNHILGYRGYKVLRIPLGEWRDAMRDRIADDYLYARLWDATRE